MGCEMLEVVAVSICGLNPSWSKSEDPNPRNLLEYSFRVVSFLLAIYIVYAWAKFHILITILLGGIYRTLVAGDKK